MNPLNAMKAGQPSPCGICSTHPLDNLLQPISCHSAQTGDLAQHSSATLTRHRDVKGVALLRQTHGATVGHVVSHIIHVLRVKLDPMIVAQPDFAAPT